jgi:hypothetical protein
MVGEDMGPLVEVSQHLHGPSYAVSIAQSARPLDYLLAHASGKPEGVIVRLKGTENVADLRSAVSAYSKSTFVFLTTDYPPRPAVARIVEQSGGALLSASESPLTVVATLIALIFQKKVR